MSKASYNAGEPLAYLLTWTTYGTWLPGDDRGWQRQHGSAIEDPNPLFTELARSRMRESEFRLAEEDREIVAATICGHCGIRGWRLHALGVRTNHVHVVVTAPGYGPETVRDQFKAWCTRKVKESGSHRSRFWTEGGSCRWINREDELEAAIVYVRDAQDRKENDGGWRTEYI